jgi:hypothetical protein
MKMLRFGLLVPALALLSLTALAAPSSAVENTAARSVSETSALVAGGQSPTTPIPCGWYFVSTSGNKVTLGNDCGYYKRIHVYWGNGYWGGCYRIPAHDRLTFVGPSGSVWQGVAEEC